MRRTELLVAFLAPALVFAVIAACAIFAGVATPHERQPYCPTEDSCQIDYRDGAWHISEATP